MAYLQNFLSKLLEIKLKDKDLNELLKGSATAFFVKIIGMFLGYVIMIYLTNKFGAKIYGEYVLGITILSIFVLFPKFGLDTALVRIIGEVKLLRNNDQVIKVLNRAFSITTIIGFLFSLIIFFYSSEIAINIFNKPSIENELVKIKWVIIPMSLIYLVAAYFQAYKKVILYILFNTTLLNFIFIGTLFFLEVFKIEYEPFFAYSISIVLTFFIGISLLAYNVYFYNNPIIKNNLIIAKQYSIKRILKTSSPMLLSSSFVLLINWLDILMLGIFSNEQSVGIYNAAQKLAVISGLSLFAINAIATPKFIEYFAKNDFKGLENIVAKSTKLIFYTSVPILIVFMVFPKAILSINGQEFVSGYTALIFLCIGKFVNSASGSVGFILQMTNNQKIFQNVLLFAAVLNGILNYFLIPKFGFNGAAFASMVTIGAWNITLVLIIKKRLGFWTLYLPFTKK